MMLDAAGTASVLDAGMRGASEWRAAHVALTRLARQRASLDFEEGTWLLAAQRAGVHARLGYGSFFEYIERLFGYSPRLTHDKLRVAGALKGLPQLAQALREGAATWSSVRELTRVATPETERAWLGAASGQTAHQVERLVSGHRLAERAENGGRRAARAALRGLGRGAGNISRGADQASTRCRRLAR